MEERTRLLGQARRHLAAGLALLMEDPRAGWGLVMCAVSYEQRARGVGAPRIA